jgi:ribosomal-protein-alanine N-acetyltransferase
MIKKIETERLELRLADLSDAPIVMSIFNDWEIIKWFQPPLVWPCNKKESYIYFRKMLAKKNVFLFMINIKNSDKDVGVIRYKLLYNGDFVYAERGFALSKNYWNKGIISEASFAGNCFFFENTEIEEIVTYNSVENKVSSKVQKNQGFKLEGIREAYSPYNTGCTSEEIWVLTQKQHKKITKKN